MNSLLLQDLILIILKFSTNAAQTLPNPSHEHPPAISASLTKAVESEEVRGATDHRDCDV